MTINEFNMFVSEAADEAEDHWRYVGGRPLTPGEMLALRQVLWSFFHDRVGVDPEKGT